MAETRFRRLSADMAVAPQLSAADVASAAAEFRTIVSNRPDGEEPGQPEAAEIAAAAAAAGLAFHHIPVGAAGLTREDAEALARIVDQSDGPVLAYCRSGMRSAALWALSQAGRHDADALIAAAAEAGYDLSGLAPLLKR